MIELGFYKPQQEEIGQFCYGYGTLEYIYIGRMNEQNKIEFRDSERSYIAGVLLDIAGKVLKTDIEYGVWQRRNYGRRTEISK